MTSAFESLQATRQILEDALSLFDGAAPDDPSVPDAMSRMTAALRELDDPATLRAEVPEADVERFDDELEELIRLNAVLVAAASRDRDELVGRLKSVRGARRDLRYYGEGLASGERCDLAG